MSGKRAAGGVSRVLVVDDEPNIREVVELYLRRNGHEVVTAADGEEALRVFGGERPDLVVPDLMLPKIRGAEVCRRTEAEGLRVRGGHLGRRPDPPLRAVVPG
ncbi:response regulator [Rubrobacter indicoceani]|uniref:response regulator n=1 Tax=Rubrobacter indicoceani TaxID=2051957 RepID=UPI0019699287|nr:response regulator [Rubrobacter indicoceani]